MRPSLTLWPEDARDGLAVGGAERGGRLGGRYELPHQHKTGHEDVTDNGPEVRQKAAEARLPRVELRRVRIRALRLRPQVRQGPQSPALELNDRLA
jgi:hypothetical protein